MWAMVLKHFIFKIKDAGSYNFDDSITLGSGNEIEGDTASKGCGHQL